MRHKLSTNVFVKIVATQCFLLLLPSPGVDAEVASRARQLLQEARSARGFLQKNKTYKRGLWKSCMSSEYLNEAALRRANRSLLRAGRSPVEFVARTPEGYDIDFHFNFRAVGEHALVVRGAPQDSGFLTFQIYNGKISINRLRSVEKTVAGFEAGGAGLRLMQVMAQSLPEYAQVAFLAEKNLAGLIKYREMLNATGVMRVDLVPSFKAMSGRGIRIGRSVTFISPPSVVHLPVLGQATQTRSIVESLKGGSYNWAAGPGRIIE